MGRSYVRANRWWSTTRRPIVTVASSRIRDKCILDREGNRHLGFGAGVHRCIGSNLARLEFRIGVEQVLARMPDYTASEAESVFHGNSVTRGFRKIPVEFTPGPRIRLG